MKRPAFLIIDMLNDFLDPWPTDKRESLINAINQLTGLARQHAFPVIWVRQEFEPDLSDAFLEMKKKNIAITIKKTHVAVRLSSHYKRLPTITLSLKNATALSFKPSSKRF